MAVLLVAEETTKEEAACLAARAYLIVQLSGPPGCSVVQL